MLPMNELFSVLVSNHNRAKFLAECLESVKKQTYTNWEVIFVDDCSTDNSVEIFKEFAKDDFRFKLYINESNQGCGYTKKRCIDMAKGEVCGFLDSDDVIVPDAIELMINVHIEHPEISIIGSRRIYCDENLKIYDVEPSIKELAKNFKSQLDNPFSINHFVTFKKSSYLKSPGQDPYLKKAVDQDLYYKLEEQGKVAFIDKPLYYYRHSSASISLFDNNYKAEGWHMYVIFETCKRRGLNFDDYCGLMKKTKSRKEKLINYIFAPYQIIKEKMKMAKNRALFERERTEAKPFVILPKN